MILAFDTSTPHCSVAISYDGHTDSMQEVLSDYSHTDKLFEYIHTLLKKHNAKASDVESIVVGLGPGSYTGLRVAASAAKGLAYALGIPVFGISSLRLIVHRFLKLHSPTAGDVVIAAIDARRMEVYASAFTSFGEALFENRAIKVTEATWTEYIDGTRKLFIAGTGVSKLSSILKHPHFQILDGVYPSAEDAIDLYRTYSLEPLDLAYFEPYYVKEFGQL